MKHRWLIVGIVLCLVASTWWAFAYPDDESSDDSLDIDSGDESTGSTVTSNSSIPTIWASMIQQFEGFFPGSRSYRDNNPGNLEITGTAGKDGVYAKFATFADGEAALIADLTAKLAKYPGYTIQQIMARYSATDQVAYAKYIAAQFTKALGQLVTPSTTLSQLEQMASGSGDSGSAATGIGQTYGYGEVYDENGNLMNTDDDGGDD